MINDIEVKDQDKSSKEKLSLKDKIKKHNLKFLFLSLLSALMVFIISNYEYIQPASFLLLIIISLLCLVSYLISEIFD